MARPKLLDVFDPSLGSGETAYTRLTSYANANISSNVLTVQSNPELHNGATIILNITNSSNSLVDRIQINGSLYTLTDSLGNNVRQRFPLSSRVAITVDTENRSAYLLNQSLPEGMILSEEDEIVEEGLGIDADTLNGYTSDAFAMRSNTYNVYATAEVIE